MRKANNNKRGRWVEVVLKGQRNENLHGYVGYVTGSGYGYRVVTFTKEGEFFRVEYLRKSEKTKNIKPPKWAANMYYVEDEADRLGDCAILYDARYKSLIGLDYEEKLTAQIKRLERQIMFFKSLTIKEPWNHSLREKENM